MVENPTGVPNTMSNIPPLTLIRGGIVFAPKPLGQRDLLLAGGRIVAIGERLAPRGIDVAAIDATDRIVVPGFIDLHVHLIGGGGEAGPASRLPELPLSDLVASGITTAVGVLGTDRVTRFPEALLAKVKALRAAGLGAYMYTGSYHLPPLTVCGSVERDLALIDEVVGVKLALSDHRGSQVTVDELARVAAQARVGGLLGNKPGLVHLHLGRGDAGLDPVFEVLDSTDLPITQFLPTHTARTPALLQQGIEFLRRGGSIDLTARPETGGDGEMLEAIGALIQSGVDLSRVSLSSDGNGSKPRFDAGGRLVGMAAGKVGALRETLVHLVKGKAVDLPRALALITTNPSSRLGLTAQRGVLQPGAWADLVLLDEALQVHSVFCSGKLVVQQGKALLDDSGMDLR
jgi:beta-aspartyl-dipeptidase (metallo-type)